MTRRTSTVALSACLAGALALFGSAVNISAASAASDKPLANGPATSFVLNAAVLDGGQQIVSVTLDTPNGVDPASLKPAAFSVRATGKNPYANLDPKRVNGEYDVARAVTGVHLNADGDVVLELAHGEGTKGASTFAWSSEAERNIMLTMTYSITQHAPLKLTNGTNLVYSQFKQGPVVDPEVDAFGAGTSRSGIKYRIYTPGTPRRSSGYDLSAKKSAGKPLVVFLHGVGEGGWSQAYNNDLPLVGNRGALSLATREAQAMFGGAYVVAPQAPTRWLDDTQYDYTARLKSLIDDVIAEKDVDPQRVSVIGPSNGGYMTMKMAATYPGFFSASVPVCGVVAFGGRTVLNDTQLRALASTPTWFIAASNDPVVPYTANTAYAHALARGSLITTYPNVVSGGHEYNGHWSWIYAANNDPINSDGKSLWQWMAAQSR